MSHATPGDLCTDACHHLCDNCEAGLTPCQDFIELPTGAIVACQADEPATTPTPECRVFGCGMPALPDGKCVRCGDGPGRGPDMCPVDCGRKKRTGHLMCGSCWGAVSAATQRDVLHTFARWRRARGDFDLLTDYKIAALTAVREVTG